MKRIFVLFLALTLSLCGCVSEPDTGKNDPFTATVPTRPNGTLDVYALTQWPVEATVSDTTRQSIKTALSEKDGIDHTGHTDYPDYSQNVICDLLWGGTWEGYEILFDLDRGTRFDMMVSNRAFMYACCFFKNGEFYNLQDIYAEGKLSASQLDTLSAMSYNIHLAFAQPAAGLWLQERLRQDAQTALQLEETDPFFINMSYCYGVYQNYVIYKKHSPQISLKPEPILAYRAGDGRSKTLGEVYRDGEISQDDYARIQEIINLLG